MPSYYWSYDDFPSSYLALSLLLSLVFVKASPLIPYFIGNYEYRETHQDSKVFTIRALCRRTPSRRVKDMTLSSGHFCFFAKLPSNWVQFNWAWDCIWPSRLNDTLSYDLQRFCTRGCSDDLYHCLSYNYRWNWNHCLITFEAISFGGGTLCFYCESLITHLHSV